MIGWLCPKPDAPSGGVMFIHRFAHILDSNGYPSRVLQAQPFEVWWDATPVPPKIFMGTAATEFRQPHNLTIIPEPLWHNEWVRWPNPIMFCQNWVWLDKRLPLHGARVIVCSRHLANYVQQNYDGNVIGIVRPYVAKGIFDGDDSKRVANRVFIINRRNNLGVKLQAILEKMKFEVVLNNGRSSQQTIAGELLRADYYAHLISPEGWPQICVEAMRAGAVVVGTTGGSGNEFMWHKETAMVAQDSVYGLNVSEDDMIYQIVSHLCFLRDNPEMKESIRRKAREWSGRYNVENSTKELLRVFEPLCSTL